MTKVSIVIPSYNEENYIDGILDSIYNSDIKYPFEVIVADSSTDNTRQIIKNHYPDVKIVKGGNVSQARNNGAKKAKGDYIIFIDADITFDDKKLINKAVKKLKKGYHMVTTKLKCRNNTIAHNIYKVCNFIQLFSVVEGMPFSTGCFMAVDKKKFFELGGFDETLHFAEDYHLSRKIKRRKFWILIKTGVYTDDRRFQKMGYFGLMKEFIRIMRNRYKNDDEFRKDIGYWS